MKVEGRRWALNSHFLIGEREKGCSSTFHFKGEGREKVDLGKEERTDSSDRFFHAEKKGEGPPPGGGGNREKCRCSSGSRKGGVFLEEGGKGKSRLAEGKGSDVAISTSSGKNPYLEKKKNRETPPVSTGIGEKGEKGSVPSGGGAARLIRSFYGAGKRKRKSTEIPSPRKKGKKEMSIGARGEGDTGENGDYMGVVVEERGGEKERYNVQTRKGRIEGYEKGGTRPKKALLHLHAGGGGKERRGGREGSTL